ncbi:MAG: TRAP transporter TatT component family protein [Pseudomonadota bacterium]
MLTAPSSAARVVKALAVIVIVMTASACGGLVSSIAGGFAEDLGSAVFNQPDPLIVEDGAPAYLLLLDSLIEGNPDSAVALAAAADLYAAYGAVFAREPERAKILTARSLEYAERAVCLEIDEGCAWPTATFDEFEAGLDEIDDDNAGLAETYGVASLAYIRAHSDDWAALARLPHIESLLLAVVDETPEADRGALYNYLGILNTLRPPALGGKPEVGRDYFERAIALTEGRDLAIKVEYARGYARLLYEQELHDQLLNEVLASEVESEGLTLTNTLAVRDAKQLLESGADYF